LKEEWGSATNPVWAVPDVHTRNQETELHGKPEKEGSRGTSREAGVGTGGEKEDEFKYLAGSGRRPGDLSKGET